jgi:hypothetical protein
MWNNLKRTVLLVALGISQAGAQDAVNPLRDSPLLIWTKDIGNGVLQGNGVFLTPNGNHLIATSEFGAVTCLDALTAETVWEYVPSSVEGSIVRSRSGVAFTTENALEPYMVYSVDDNENSINSRTRVIALDMDGNELWASLQMEGVAAGTPVVSDNGDYVFLTHNAALSTIGYFSALWAAANGTVFYSMSNETSAFAPLGIYHSPAEGYYDGENGVDNTNDIMMWSVAPQPDATSIGDGATFAFQFPKNFSDDSQMVGYILLGDEPKDFQATTPPAITNSGRSAYWSVSRSSYTAWVGAEGLDRWHFNRGGSGNAGFTRNGDFPGTPCFAAPALSSDPEQPAIFGGSAFTEFVRLSYDLSEQFVVLVDNYILAKAVVDPENRSVYYVESSSGLIHQASFVNIEDIWTYILGFSVEGEIALSSDGSFLYVADVNGRISAIQVADIPATPAPTMMPSGFPSSSIPSDFPSSGPTSAPVIPTEPPTREPTVTTDAPTAGPTVTVTPEPTREEMPSAPPAEASGAAQPMWLVALVGVAAFMLV